MSCLWVLQEEDLFDELKCTKKFWIPIQKVNCSYLTTTHWFLMYENLQWFGFLDEKNERRKGGSFRSNYQRKYIFLFIHILSTFFSLLEFYSSDIRSQVKSKYQHKHSFLLWESMVMVLIMILIFVWYCRLHSFW